MQRVYVGNDPRKRTGEWGSENRERRKPIKGDPAVSATMGHGLSPSVLDLEAPGYKQDNHPA